MIAASIAPAASGGGMSSPFRIWAVSAMALAVLFALRGAWLAALAVFLLSPAPALAFGRSGAGPLRMSLTSLGVVVAAMAVLLVLIIAIVASGGLPQVHEWRALLRG
jgi:hypothetical protein